MQASLNFQQTGFVFILKLKKDNFFICFVFFIVYSIILIFPLLVCSSLSYFFCQKLLLGPVYMRSAASQWDFPSVLGSWWKQWSSCSDWLTFGVCPLLSTSLWYIPPALHPLLCQKSHKVSISLHSFSTPVFWTYTFPLVYTFLSLSGFNKISKLAFL